MSKLGRSTKLTIEEVNSVILDFRKNVKTNGRISYSEIYNHSLKMFDEGLINNVASDNFWRKEGRMGRIEVDKANDILSEVVKNKDKITFLVENMDLGNKELLLSEIEKIKKEKEKLLANNSILADECSSFKNKLIKEQEKNKILQNVVYELYRIASETTDSKKIKVLEEKINNLITFSLPTKNDIVPNNISSLDSAKKSSRFKK